MTSWIYEYAPAPVAKWVSANGLPSVELDVPEDDCEYGDHEAPGTQDWIGESIIFQGTGGAHGKEHAIHWLESALAAVRALPDADPDQGAA